MEPIWSDTLYIRHPRRWVVAILMAYLLVGIGFAAFTPPWQAPDEPAHYNYIADIVHNSSLPVLRMGDYNQEYLEGLKQAHFPSHLSISGVRYESYQPPLFYLIASPIFLLGEGRLLVLRLFNLGLGLIALWLLYRCLALVFPNKSLIGLSALAFAALLPMHVAVAASLNNDILAELLLNASFYVLLLWISKRADKEGSANLSAQPALFATELRTLFCLGILLGCGLLTKVYAYAALPLCVLAILIVYWRTSDSWKHFLPGIGRALWVALPALLMGLPWWLRNLRLYGNGDFLGINWHDQVVVGQPRTIDWITEFGLMEYSERAFTFTFRSFWGVFGWLGVFMDERIYNACLLFSGVLFFGLLWSLVRLISGKPDTEMSRFQTTVLLFFCALFCAVVASYAWYNLKFVQHQGRYFFWGLLPISAWVALGWREVLRPTQGMITGVMGVVLSVSLAVAGLVSGEIDKWSVLTVGLMAIVLLAQPIFHIPIRRQVHLKENSFSRLQRLRYRLLTRLDRLAHHWLLAQLAGLGRIVIWALPFLLLFLLDLLIPFLYILPQLAQ